MKLKDMTKDELKDLMEKNRWFKEQVYNNAYENAMFLQEADAKAIGADAFNYHDHYSSFYLTCPTVSGAKAPEKLVGKLDMEYLGEEDAKLYKELCELNAKMEDAEEWDEERPEYARMLEIGDLLADHTTQYLRSYEEITDDMIDQELDYISEDTNWLGDLEIVNGKIKEEIYH